MKKILVILVAFISFGFSANAQITKEERDKLTDKQKKIYDTQSKEIKETKEWNVFKAEDKVKMGKEMKQDNAKFAGAYYQIKGASDKEKAEKKAKEDQGRLDKAARQAIKNNEEKDKK